jgi:hypothetical protein
MNKTILDEEDEMLAKLIMPFDDESNDLLPNRKIKQDHNLINISVPHDN